MRKERKKSDVFDEGYPYSHEAENSVLSAALHSPREVIPDIVGSGLMDWFYHPSSIILAKALILMFTEDRPIELPAIAQVLLDSGEMDKVGGAGTLAEIYSIATTAAHYPYYKGLIRDKHTQRQLLINCDKIREDIHSGAADINLSVTRASSMMDKVAQDFLASSARRTWSEDCADFDVSFGEKLGKKKTSALSSRWIDFDRKFGGITKEFFVVKGKTSHGKTTLALNMLETVAIFHGEPCIWFPYEMKTQSLIARLIASISGVNSDKVFKPDVFLPNRGDVKKISEALALIERAPIEIVKERALCYHTIERRCDEFKARHGGLSLVGIDYLQKMPPPPSAGKNDSPADKYAENSRLLFDLQQSLSCTMIVISSTNQNGGTLGSQGPDYDTDNCISVDRDKGIIIEKNRNGGGVGDKLDLIFNGPNVRYENNQYSEIPN